MKIAIIGGGASGLMAAIIAKRRGADVTIYEKLNKVGKKILATGNGRCNYTNMYVSIDRYHGNNVEPVENIFNKFDLNNTLDFFEKLGVYPYIDEFGKVYPNSLQSSSIVDVLKYEVDYLGIENITDFEVKELRKNKDTFNIIGNGVSYIADKVILCCGGKASPQLGSDGKGYEIAKSLGHKIIETFPALVQLKLEGKYFKRISGVRFDGLVKGFSDEKFIRAEDGEVLFTDYGISGPTILQISRKVIEEFNKGKRCYVSVDMFPKWSKNDLYDILSKRFSVIGYKSLEDSLIGFVNKKLIPVILIYAGFENKNIQCSKLNKKDIYNIIEILKNWKFEVIGHNTWEQAQVTAGGVDLSQINCETLESNKVKGLYFAGEILDVDGDCGGFNLQWAWSSGYAAGYYSSM